MSPSPATVDEYISQQPQAIQLLLSQIREAIREAAPQAIEKISYGMPGFYQNGMLVWYAAARRHIGFYPTPAGIEAFPEALTYRGSKGSMHFPLDQPIPLDLVRQIVLFRLDENLKKRPADR